MARVQLPPGEGWERERMWSLRPEMGELVEDFSTAVQEYSILPPRVLEAARMRIAVINGCIACQSSRPSDAETYGLDAAFYDGLSDPALRDRYSDREQAAIEFGERFIAGAAAFDDPFWERMHAAFTDEEIVDLSVCCAKWLAFGRMNAVLDLVPDCPVYVQALGKNPSDYVSA